MDSSLQYYEVTFWVSLWHFFLKSILSDMSITTPAFFFPVHLLGIFVSSPSLSVCVGLLFWGGSLVGSICVGHAFSSILLFYVFWLGHLIHLRLMLLLIGPYSLPFFHTCVPLSFPVLLPVLIADPLAFLQNWFCGGVFFEASFVWKLLIWPSILI